ncbi:MAG TPA: PQQ-binding-like beta-propeller repeat protein [Armatimonadota bacterium]|jgi:WD40 repeat protein
MILLLAGASAVRGQILERVWARFLPRCESFAVSADGTVVVSADWDGAVQAYAEDGRVLWRTRFPDKVTCVPANGGVLSVAFTPQSSTNRKVYLLDEHGRTLRIEKAPGNVRTVEVSDDGKTAVILSEPARVTVVRRLGHRWRWQRTLLPGTVTSLSLDSTGSRIAVAHRDPAGIVLLTSSLKTVWRFAGSPAESYRLQISPNGDVLAALTMPPPGGIAEAFYWRTDNAAPVWRRTIRGDLARISLSPAGDFVAAGYRTRLWHGRKSVVESRVTLFSNSGRRLWEVGGLIFPAQLVGTSPGPTLVMTHDNARVLAALDSGGHMRARHRLIAPIRSCVMARAGRHFTVLTDARVLYLFRRRG